jgi:hypothetical protein
MSKRIIYLCVMAWTVTGCGEVKSSESPLPYMAVDLGGMAPDMGPLPFLPTGEPETPGADSVFAPKRARCQLVIEHRSPVDMNLEARQVWTYDDQGNLLLDEWDQDANGVFDRRISRQFSDVQKPVRVEEDRDGDGVPDSRVVTEYEDGGRATALYDDDADGMIDRREVKVYSGDRVVEQSWYSVSDDSLQSRTTFQFDMAGRLLAMEGYDGVDANPMFRLQLTYDDMGRQISTRQDDGADGVYELEVDFAYDDATRTKTTTSVQPSEQRSAKTVEIYDDLNRLLQRTVDIGDDGTFEETVAFVYSDGVLLSRESSTSAARSRKTYDYNPYARVSRVVEDDDLGTEMVDRITEYTHHCRTELSGGGS